MSIESYPSPNGVLTSLIWRKTAAGGETSLSGYDNASQALSYTPGQEQVYLNGILLVRGSDYTATNGTSITGLTALAADDFVQINCYNNFSVASVPTTSLTGTVANNQLANSSITINGSAVSLGGSVSLPGDIESVTASSPLTGGGSSGALTIGIQSASTSQAGSVQLSDSTSTTSSVLAATPTAVKSAYDLANGAIPKTLTTTTGDIIYASGANTPARLGIGSTGNVLTVASGVPSWSAPAGGGMTLISTSTLSNASSISLTSIPTTYTHLELVFIRFHGGSQGWTDPGCFCTVRFNSDSNGVYIGQMSSVGEAGHGSGSQDVNATSIGGNGGTGYFGLFPSFDSTTNSPYNARWTIFNYASTTLYRSWEYQNSGRGTYGGAFYVGNGSGYYNSTGTAITQIDFTRSGSSGNFNGTLQVWGLK